MSSSSSWQDRRFMFPVGREVHEGSAARRASQSSSTAESPVLTTAAPAAGVTPALPEYPVVDKKVLSNPDAWGGDRRFMGMIGKEVHAPARRSSGSSDTKPAVMPKSSSPPATTAGGGITAAIAGRRRSSASSQGGIFSGLMNNRSSDTHAERRESWADMKKPEGLGGFFSGLVGGKSADKK